MEKRKLWEEINTNEELIQLEREGFERGEKKGKTMDVPLDTVVDSLKKQFRDFARCYRAYKAVPSKNYKNGLKRTISDLRNAGGCVFLKLLEGGDTKRQKIS